MKSTNFKLNASPSKKSHKKLLIVLIVLVLLIGAGGAVLLARRNAANKRAADEKAQSEAQTDSAKKDVENGKLSSTPSDAAAATRTTDQVPTSTSLSVQIAPIKEESGSVSASAAVTPTSNSGYCIFSYTSTGGRPVVSGRVSPSNGLCSWSKSANSFDFIGDWNLNVTYYVNDTKAEANKSVTIN